MTTRTTILTALLGALLAAAPCAADSIALRGSVRLDAGKRVVHLGDIAVLTGPEAEAFSKLVLLELGDAAAVAEINVRDVRAKLTEAGAHWGRIDLSGGRTTVRGRPHADAAAPMAMTGAAVPASADARKDDDAAWSGAEIAEEASLRGELFRFVSRAIGTAPKDLRLSIHGTDATVPLLTTHELRFEIEPLGGFNGAQAEVSVRAWRDNRAVERWILRLAIKVRREIAVAARDIDRGETVTTPDRRVEARWLAPSAAAASAPIDAVVGRIAARPLKAGEPILESRLKKDLVIRRGDVVMVRCVVGGLVVSMKAEARSAGAAGDTIELRKPGERETFLAAVSGPAEAIIDLTRELSDSEGLVP